MLRTEFSVEKSVKYGKQTQQDGLHETQGAGNHKWNLLSESRMEKMCNRPHSKMMYRKLSGATRWRGKQPVRHMLQKLGGERLIK